ncbi:MAG TPA: hypothetical protein VE801_03000 [Xanthobacteraceae bacterium]|nr:hypothetical protein [Xanthobacteraceae bacterium]
MSRVARILPCVVVAAAVGAMDAPVMAQLNLDRGKSAAQIFADTCNACHRSPREIKPSSATFLRDHYTTGPREAAAMAAYLASVGSDARAVQQRRPPTLGAGQASSPAPDQGKPADSQAAQAGNERTAGAARPRRPSESVETGSLPIAAEQGGGEGGPPQAAATTAVRQSTVEAFEE